MDILCKNTKIIWIFFNKKPKVREPKTSRRQSDRFRTWRERSLVDLQLPHGQELYGLFGRMQLPRKVSANQSINSKMSQCLILLLLKIQTRLGLGCRRVRRPQTTRPESRVLLIRERLGRSTTLAQSLHTVPNRHHFGSSWRINLSISFSIFVKILPSSLFS